VTAPLARTPSSGPQSMALAESHGPSEFLGNSWRLQNVLIVF
jgi:hypothetical protein